MKVENWNPANPLLKSDCICLFVVHEQTKELKVSEYLFDYLPTLKNHKMQKYRIFFLYFFHMVFHSFIFIIRFINQNQNRLK